MSCRSSAVNRPGMDLLGLREMEEGRDVTVQGSQGQKVDHVPRPELRRLDASLALILLQLTAPGSNLVPDLLNESHQEDLSRRESGRVG